MGYLCNDPRIPSYATVDGAGLPNYSRAGLKSSSAPATALFCPSTLMMMMKFMFNVAAISWMMSVHF